MEISEEIKELKQKLIDYERNPQKKPFSIAVFGEQGRQRTQKLKDVFIETLTNELKYYHFDLTDFSDYQQLIGAFVQISNEKDEMELYR